jgi:hypothetical protein
MISKSGFCSETGGGQLINNQSVEQTIYFNDVINQPFEESVQFNDATNHSVQFNDIIDQPLEKYNRYFQVPFSLSLLFFTVHKLLCVLHLLRQFLLHFNYLKMYLSMSFATASSWYALSYTADTGFCFSRKEIIKHIFSSLWCCNKVHSVWCVLHKRDHMSWRSDIKGISHKTLRQKERTYDVHNAVRSQHATNNFSL